MRCTQPTVHGSGLYRTHQALPSLSPRGLPLSAYSVFTIILSACSPISPGTWQYLPRLSCHLRRLFLQSVPMIRVKGVRHSSVSLFQYFCYKGAVAEWVCVHGLASLWSGQWGEYGRLCNFGYIRTSIAFRFFSRCHHSSLNNLRVTLL